MAGAGEDAERLSYAELEALVVELRAHIVEQDQLVAELRQRLGMNSRNSSKPPSADGYSKPPVKKDRSLRGRSQRKPGGQEGHEGAHLERVEVAHHEVLHEPKACTGCGSELTDAKRIEGREESREVFDLPEEIALRVTQHVAVNRLCGACGQENVGSFPEDVKTPVQYGPDVKALGAYLHVFQHIPYDRARQVIFDLTGADISTGTLKAWVVQAAEGLTDFDEELRSLLAKSDVVHFDETGARIAGRLGWIHSASTETLTRYTAHERRGTVAMDAADVLPGFSGVAVHDGWKAYQAYLDAIHALCAGHHLRELIAAQEAGELWAAGMSCLLLDTHDTVEKAKPAGAEALSRDVLDELHDSYRELIAMGYEEHPGLAEGADQRMKRTKAENLLLRALLTFPWAWWTAEKRAYAAPHLGFPAS